MLSIPAKAIAWCRSVRKTLRFCLNVTCLTSNRVDDIWMILPRGRIIGKLEEGQSVTSVAEEYGFAHRIVSRAWKAFQATGIYVRGFSCGFSGANTVAHDRHIVLQVRRDRRQTSGEIAKHMQR